MIYREGSFGAYTEDVFGTLSACGGNNGGGREPDRAERSRRQQYEH